MYRTERLNKILEIISQKKSININELEALIFESKSTLRRDLILLEEEGKIIRKFGQVEIVEKKNVEFGYNIRCDENITEKKYIVDLASDFIGNNQALIVDSSSTANLLDSYIMKKINMIVITNSLYLALSLNNSSKVRTYLLGGRLLPHSGSMAGETTRKSLSSFYADISFMSCSALNSEGVYMTSEDQTTIKREMLKQSKLKVLLCDSSKIGKIDYYKLGNLDEFDIIITDKEPDKEFLDKVKSLEIEILY